MLTGYNDLISLSDELDEEGEIYIQMLGEFEEVTCFVNREQAEQIIHHFRSVFDF
jgi:hypothetical protein